MLSPKVKELIAKSRIVSFQTWQPDYPAPLIQIFQNADDDSRYLTDQDLENILAVAPNLETSVAIAKTLRDDAANIVEKSRADVLQIFPNITETGGELYPAARAEACWRDFWHFLRCISYGVAGDRPNFTSDEGLHHMEQLYQELQVPLPAMICGIQSLKIHSMSHIPPKLVGKQAIACFEHLHQQLQQFERK